MTSRDFCYWLQGFFEINRAGFETALFQPQLTLSSEQTAAIERHLALVFKHEIDPSAGPAEHQKALNQIHAGTAPQVQGVGRLHAAGCQMDTDHEGKCETRKPQIGGVSPDGKVFRC